MVLMAPLPVIDNVFRIAVNGHTSSGATSTNIFHVFTASNDVTQMYADLNDQWSTADLFRYTSGRYLVDSVGITPLDGVTPTQVFPAFDNDEGTAGADYLVEGCAVLSMKTGIRGPRGRGRLYTPFVAEGAQADGLLAESSLEPMSTSWNDFNEAMIASTTNAAMVVASYEHHAQAAVTAFSVSPHLGLQRRRLIRTR